MRLSKRLRESLSTLSQQTATLSFCAVINSRMLSKSDRSSLYALSSKLNTWTMVKFLLSQYRSRRLSCAGNELPASFCSSVLTRAIRIAFMVVLILLRVCKVISELLLL
ncbi:MAG TPA: hypothetical protein VFF04_00340 [Candidatus Babeliales bacterium]|nr:hypothetical protein [Candidatus Babeliales bacterium]